MDQIIIRYDDEGLFGGNEAGINIATSAAKYGEMVEAAVRTAYPNATIDTEYSPTMQGDEYLVDGEIDEDETEAVREIARQIYEGFAWVVTLGPVDFDLIFDNGGGITLQTADGYRHNYDDPVEVANDVNALLGGNDYADAWDGNEAEDYEVMTYDAEVERNGGYRWLTRAEIVEIIAGGEYPAGSYQSVFGYNDANFFQAMGVAVAN
jgi:hypothetical protein